MKISDQTGREIVLNNSPERIVSCVPSISELIYDLGFLKELKGCTKFCIYPDHMRSECTIIGGTKNLRTQVISSLNPDLILVNKEENVKEQVEELMDRYPVYVSDVKSIDDGTDLIRDISELLGVASEGNKLSKRINLGFDEMSSRRKTVCPNRVVYFIWKEPWMTVGGDTYINDVLSRAGYENVFAEKDRYPEVLLHELKTEFIDEIFLSSEPYPFTEKDRQYIEEKIPGVKVKLVDGSMFSWYGSRMEKAAAYLSRF